MKAVEILCYSCLLDSSASLIIKSMLLLSMMSLIES